MWKSKFDYCFIIFIFDIYYSFFIGSGWFSIVERSVYDSTPIVLKKLDDGTSSDIKKIFAKETEILAKIAMKTYDPCCQFGTGQCR